MAGPGDRLDRDPEASQNKSWFSTWWEGQQEELSVVTEELSENPILEPVGSFLSGAKKALRPGLGSPLSSGIRGMDVASQGGTWSLQDQEDYTQRSKENSIIPGGGAGIIGAPLMSGLVVADKVWSNGVARPVSTAFLANRRINDDGWEWDVLRKSWNRSEKVSFGQAALPRELVSMFSDIEDYDPWSDYDLSDLANNPVFNIISGSTDGALNIMAGPSLKVARVAAISRTFGGTTVKSAADLARYRSDYVDHARYLRQGEDLDEGVFPRVLAEGDQELIDSGARTTYGEAIFDIAQETRPEVLRLNPVVANSHHVNKKDFADILAETKDPNTVNNIVLASRGDELAVKELVDAADPAVWRLADMNSSIQANAVAGNRYAPTGAALAKVNEIFDNQLKMGDPDKVAYFAKLQEMFTDPAGQMRGSADWMPSKRFIIEKIRGGQRKRQYAVQYADYSDAPQWIKVSSESGLGKPVTSFMQWVGGRKPLGLVSRSGARPNELATEFEGIMNSIPEFRGTKTVPVIADDGVTIVEVSASGWRKSQFAKIQAITDDTKLEAAWREMEDETLAVLARIEGVDFEDAKELVRAIREQSEKFVDDMNRNQGYIFDEGSERILIDPVSQRQFLSSFTTVNMGEVRNALIINKNSLQGIATKGTTLGTSAFDLGMKFFRTDVLFRLGYMPKNAMLEPLTASLIAHGSILADDGMFATVGRFTKNRSNMARSLAYRSDIVERVKKAIPGVDSATIKELQKEMNALAQQRAAAQRNIDLLVSDMDSIDGQFTSPGLQESQRIEIASRLGEARRQMEATEIGMDQITPEWRQIPQPITVEELARRKREYAAIIGRDTDYSKELQDEINGIYLLRAETAGAERLNLDVRIENLKHDIDILEDERVFLAEEYQNTLGVSEIGAQRAAGRPAGERIDPTTVHPDLSKTMPNTKNTGLAEIAWVERILEDVKLSPAQRKRAAELGQEWKEAGSIDRPLVVMWDSAQNKIYVDPKARGFGEANDTIVELAAMKAAGFNSVPVTIVTRKIPKGIEGIELPAGKWLNDNPGTGGSRRATPRGMHPNDVFPRQYGALEDGRVVGKPTSPSRANDFDGDLARGRDLNAYRNERQRKSVEAELAREEEKARGLKTPKEMTFDDVTPSLTRGEAARVNRNNEIIARISDRENLPLKTKAEVEVMITRLDGIEEEIRLANLTLDEPVSKLLDSREVIVQEIQDRMAELSPQLGSRLKKIEDVSGKLNWEGSDEGYITVMVGGKKISIPAAFNNEGYNMGAGYRAEASAALTSRATWDPSSSATGLKGHWARTGNVKDLAPHEDGYWEELAYVIKAHFRGDRFIQKILEGETDENLMLWIRSQEGVAYQKSMGKEYLVTETSYINNTKVVADRVQEMRTVIRLVKQYIPDEKVRKRAAAGELGPADLQKSMGGRSDLSHVVGKELQASGLGPLKQGAASASKVLDNVWQWIATMPEDRLARWPFYGREFQIQMQRMIDVREGVDGTTIALDAIPALRQAAHRITLDELEKTFYNIRRYNNAVYMSRFLLGFPGAMFNSVYRYGRFAVKEPERLTAIGNVIGSGVATFGVDEEGNKVDSISEAVYLVVPGTVNEDRPEGIRVPVNFMDSIAVGAPSPSYGAAVAVSAVYKLNPASEQALKDLMGEENYDLMFPYGVQANPAANILSSYQKSFLSAWKEFDDEAFLKASVNIHAHEMAQWEKNGSDPEAMPDYKQSKQDTRNFFLFKMGFKFADSFSTQIPNVTRVPGQFMRDKYRMLKESYPQDQAGREAADVAFIAKYGEWAEWYTKSTTNSRVYVPSTQEAFKRLWKDNAGLTEQLVAMNPKDITMVGLLATGTDTGDFSNSVYNYLKDNPLPGDTKPISEKMTPLQFAASVKVEEGYAAKKRSKALLDAELVRLRTLRDAATTSMPDREMYREDIVTMTDAYDLWLDDLKGSNEEFAASQTSIQIRKRSESAALYLKKILDNDKFMSSVKDDPTWENFGFLLRARTTLKEALALPDLEDEAKDTVIIEYLTYVRDNLSTDPDFDGVWERYFSEEFEVKGEELETE